MRKLLLILFLAPFLVLAQLPYTWVANTNPGWTSSNGVLSWKPGCTVVTTNCTGNYASNINSTYTSPIINATCSNASTIVITFTASGNAEYSWDFLFIEYSLNGGATWINPYGAGTGWTGNFGAGSTIPAIIVPTSANFMFRFNFQSDGSFNYSGYKITDFDIGCNVVLPIQLTSFKGYKETKGNRLAWDIESEVNCDHYIVERSLDGEIWELISTVSASGSKYYWIMDTKYEQTINYYRLTQVDLDGVKVVYEDNLVSIDNRGSKVKLLSITNSIGQNVSSSYHGIVFLNYEDGTIIRTIQ